jgi:P-type Cu2+ transporter
MGVAAPTCFHCGEAIPHHIHIQARIRGDNAWFEKAVCCIGCKAVAELICGAGLNDYYRFRQTPGQRPDRASSESTRSVYSIYDQTELYEQLTRPEAEGLRSADLILDGIGCAACGWLIDRMLKQQPGVETINVNVATARVHVRWQPRDIRFSQVLQAIAELGYKPHPLTLDAAIDVARNERHHALKRLAVAAFGMMQVMMFAVAMYTGEHEMSTQIKNYLRIVSALCATPVMFYAGWPILTGAWNALRVRMITMDVPVSLGLVLAFVASLWNTVAQQGDIYFDSVVMFVFFLNTARFIEMLARHRTGNLTDALARLIPPTAHRLQANDEVIDVATSQLSVGDRLLIRVGEVIPADARIEQGTSVIDESMLTGESNGVSRKRGDLIAAGTLNLQAPLTVMITAIGSATVLSNIVRLLERAGVDKATMTSATTSMADRVAAMFLSRLLFGVIVVAIAWYFIDPTRVLPVTLAVLVAACPCALSLAMPTVLAAATASLARKGVLVVKADALETLSKVSRVVFDKTGTLTHGRPAILNDELLSNESHTLTQCRAIAAALEAHSEHPIANAFRNLDCNGVRYVAANVSVTPGAGIEGEIDGRRYRIGRAEFVSTNLNPLNSAHPELVEGIFIPMTVTKNQEPFDKLKANGKNSENAVVLADEHGPLAAFHLGDQLRDEAPQVIAQLKAMRLPSQILSGDAHDPVAQVASQCGIDNYQYRQTPQSKLQTVQALRDADQVALMVGDGINDAPVLKGASVSIATARASALAQVSADIVLVGDTLNALPATLRIAHRARRIIKQNMIWATLYNTTALSLAAFGLLPPWLAAIGMSLSSMFVVLNAWRLAPNSSRASSSSSVDLLQCPSSTT